MVHTSRTLLRIYFLCHN
uniref:Uncharacterized protein n=1 Tax=Arundo donax TaxID=35708 RepID=A0A0A9AHT1_ARUDO